MPTRLPALLKILLLATLALTGLPVSATELLPSAPGPGAQRLPIWSTSGATYGVTIQVPGRPTPTRFRYYLATATALKAPAAMVQEATGRRRRPDHRADYIAIVHPDLAATEESLLAHRRAEALRVTEADVQAIYAEFGHGLVHPEAIRAFLTYAYRHWNRGLYAAIFQTREERLGDAMDAAKLHFFSRSPAWQDLIDTAMLLGDPALKLRLLGSDGQQIGRDALVESSTVAQSLCGGSSSVGCGNRTTRWIGFVGDAQLRVKAMLVVVGADDAGGDGNGEHISFIAPTIVLSARTTPLAVEMASFQATASRAYVLLTWETVFELGTLGFNLYRGERERGPWLHLNRSLIPVHSPGSPMGFAYAWHDWQIRPGATYFYRLEAVTALGGTQLTEAVRVTVGPLYFLRVPIVLQ